MWFSPPPSAKGKSNGMLRVITDQLHPGRPIGLTYRCMTYNLLSNEYAASYASDLYRHAPPWCLESRARLPLILHEIATWRPDVVCMQEVDGYEELERGMGGLGYQGVYLQRSGGRSDGCATFWNAARLSVAPDGVDRIHMRDHGLKDNVALLLMMTPTQEAREQQHQQQQEQHRPHQHQHENPHQHQQNQHQHQQHQHQHQHQHQQQQGGGVTGQQGTGGLGAATGCGAARLLVANTHVMFNPKRGDIKLGQLRVILDRMWHLASSASSSGNPVACMFMGDFNLAPGSPLYSFLDRGHLSYASLDRNSLAGQVEGYGYPHFQRDLASGVNPLLCHQNAAQPPRHPNFTDHPTSSSHRPRESPFRQQQQQQQQTAWGCAAGSAAAATAANGGLTIAELKRQQQQQQQAQELPPHLRRPLLGSRAPAACEDDMDIDPPSEPDLPPHLLRSNPAGPRGGASAAAAAAMAAAAAAAAMTGRPAASFSPMLSPTTSQAPLPTWAGPYSPSAYQPWEQGAAAAAEAANAAAAAAANAAAAVAAANAAAAAFSAAGAAASTLDFPSTSGVTSAAHTPFHTPTPSSLAGRESRSSTGQYGSVASGGTNGTGGRYGSGTPGLGKGGWGSSGGKRGAGGQPRGTAAAPLWRLRWDQEALLAVLGSAEAAAAAAAAAQAAADAEAAAAAAAAAGALGRRAHMRWGEEEGDQEEPASAAAETPADSAPHPALPLLACSHPFVFGSAYHDTCGAEPPFTTCHARYIGTVDYIWYSPLAVQRGAVQGGTVVSLHPVRCLLPPDARAFLRGMPNPAWPSDHISLLADFQLMEHRVRSDGGSGGGEGSHGGNVAQDEEVQEEAGAGTPPQPPASAEAVYGHASRCEGHSGGRSERHHHHHHHHHGRGDRDRDRDRRERGDREHRHRDREGDRDQDRGSSGSHRHHSRSHASGSGGGGNGSGGGQARSSHG